MGHLVDYRRKQVTCEIQRDYLAEPCWRIAVVDKLSQASPRPISCKALILEESYQ